MDLQDFILRLPVKIINNIRPDAKWHCKGGVEYDNLIWEDDSISKPSREEYENEFNRLVDEFKSLEYQRQRVTEYPPIGDQLDALFHAGVFPPEMAEKIQEVKDKYPKQS